MFSSQILDVAIGLLLMFLFQSILISGIHDLVVSLLAIRGKILKQFLMTALKTKEAKDTIFEQLSSSPFINNLKRKKRFPAEITSKNFSDSIIELIIREDASNETYINKIKNNIEKLPDSEFKSILIARLNESGDNYENFKNSIEQWFNDYMDRISRWYKKRVNYFMYLFAFTVTLALNVDALFVMNELWKNPKLRESAVVMSQNVIQKSPEEITGKKYTSILTDSSTTKDSINVALNKVEDSYQNLHMLDFPITWAYAYEITKKKGDAPMDQLNLWGKLEWTASQITIEKFLGFIITTLAVSIGAPIWYDLIKKLIGAREMIKKKA